MTGATLQKLIDADGRERGARMGHFVERMEFPNIRAVHFDVYGILGRRCSSSTLLENLGKGFTDYVRGKVVDVPVPIL